MQLYMVYVCRPGISNIFLFTVELFRCHKTNKATCPCPISEWDGVVGVVVSFCDDKLLTVFQLVESIVCCEIRG